MWDVADFAAYCEAFADMVQATNGLNDPEANLTHLDRGRWMRQKRDASSALVRFGREFGLTPSSRSGIKIEMASADEAADIMTPKRVRGPAS